MENKNGKIDAKNSVSVHWFQNKSWRRVLGEVEKNSFITLPGKRGHSGLMASKLCVPTKGDFIRSFMAVFQG